MNEPTVEKRISGEGRDELAILRQLRSAVFDLIEAHEYALIAASLHQDSINYRAARDNYEQVLKTLFVKARETIGLERDDR